MLRIGQLADQAQVPIDTVRYYERAGLLQPPNRSAAGYRLYDGASVHRLRFVRRAKRLGFSLDDIAELLRLSDRRGDIAGVRATAQAKLSEIEARIVELSRIRDGLSRLVDACPGHGDAADCPILGALNHDVPEQDRYS